MKTYRLKATDYWIYPQPIRRGDWRVTRIHIGKWPSFGYRRFENRYAWKVRQQLSANEPAGTWADYRTEICHCEFICREPGVIGCSYEA